MGGDIVLLAILAARRAIDNRNPVRTRQSITMRVLSIEETNCEPGDPRCTTARSIMGLNRSLPLRISISDVR
jgi:hypothetical protein